MLTKKQIFVNINVIWRNFMKSYEISWLAYIANILMIICKLLTFIEFWNYTIFHISISSRDTIWNQIKALKSMDLGAFFMHAKLSTWNYQKRSLLKELKKLRTNCLTRFIIVTWSVLQPKNKVKLTVILI